MSGKKKKMTPAQAASARREKTAESAKRAKAKERSQLIKKSAQAAQRQANRSVGLRMVLPFIVVGAIIVLALAFTVGPGLLMGR